MNLYLLSALFIGALLFLFWFGRNMKKSSQADSLEKGRDISANIIKDQHEISIERKQELERIRRRRVDLPLDERLREFEGRNDTDS